MVALQSTHQCMGQGQERSEMQSKYDMKCGSSAYKKPSLMLQNSTGSCKPRTENPSVVTLRDQTSNGELLQRLEQQNPRMKPLLPETYEVPASDEAFPTQSLQYLS